MFASVIMVVVVGDTEGETKKEEWALMLVVFEKSTGDETDSCCRVDRL
jgi:hypothetical protein